MRIGVIGAGAVGGYYAAMLARAGHDVAVVARGAHLAAMRDLGLSVRATRGAFTVRVRASDDPGELGPCDLLVFAVKTYDTASALPAVSALTGPETVVLTLQNGVDSSDELAAAVGPAAVVAGAAYIATAIAAPGVIEQTGLHHRIVFGEVFAPGHDVSPRVARIADALREAGIEIEAAADARVPLWEKFIYLAPFAGFTGAARLPIGRLWEHEGTRGMFAEACAEVERVARAEGVNVAVDVIDRIRRYVDALPPATRSSLLIDLQAGKRIEVEALQGSVVRRARRAGVPVPIVEALYTVLRPHASGAG